jgi:hypothetical protein
MLEAPSVNPRCKGLCDGNIGFQPIFNNRFEKFGENIGDYDTTVVSWYSFVFFLLQHWC